MCYTTITRLKTAWRVRNTLVIRTRWIPAEILGAIYIPTPASFFFSCICLDRAKRDRRSRAAARSLAWSADLFDDFGILLDRAVIEIGFAARCVTFAGFRANIETQRISFAHRRARCNRKSNGRPSFDRSRF